VGGNLPITPFYEHLRPHQTAMGYFTIVGVTSSRTRMSSVLQDLGGPPRKLRSPPSIRTTSKSVLDPRQRANPQKMLAM
jgi:hypothetical protein